MPKRFIYFFALGFLAFAAIIITLHILGNPDGLFPSPRFPSRDYLGVKTRQLDRLIDSGNPPQAIIFGSSRSMEMAPAVVRDITGFSTYNYAFIAASAVQELAQLKYIIARGDHPKLLVLSVDERGMFGHFTPVEGRLVESWGVLRQASLWKQISLFSIALTQIKLETTPQAIENIYTGPFTPHTLLSQTSGILMDDGYRIRIPDTIRRVPTPRHPNPQTPAQRRAYLKNKISQEYINDVENLATFREGKVQSEQKYYVSKIIQTARDNQIRVIVIITPMQPYFDRMVMRGSSLKEMNRYVHSLQSTCEKYGAQLFDFRKMKSFAGLDYEFWDAQHPTSINTMRMLNKALGLDPQTPHPNVPTDYDLLMHPTTQNTLNTW